MQPLLHSSNLQRRCAHEVMGAVPPVVWYMRRQMRGNRGGLSMPQFRALVRLERDPSTSITEIAEHLAASLSTTSRLISGLVRREFLERETAPVDRRQARISITAKGAAVLQAARDATGKELQGVFATLDLREQQAVIHAMHILRRLFGSGVADPSVASTDSHNGNGRSIGRNRPRSARV